jgi:hypothetical protein
MRSGTASFAALLLTVVCLQGCSGSGGTSSTTGTAGTTTGATSSSGGSTGGEGTQQLTVKNYLSWCSVTVNGGAASSSATQTVSVSPGNVTLTASPNSGFMLGLWHHTASDTGSGDPGSVSGSTSTATTTVGNAAACVWVCCPFTDGTGCPTTDQCP